MSSGLVQLVEVVDPSLRLGSILGQRTGVLCLAAARTGLHLLSDAAASLPLKAVGIVPLSEAARRLWSALPTELAVLAILPLNGSATVLHAEHARGFSEISLWEFVVQQVCQLQILPAADQPDFSVQFPPLLGQERPLPDWLVNRILRATAGTGTYRRALQAGLLLMHDQLDASHQISQELEGAGANHPGDYWHAIMHRREGDFGNSKYWFRQVGQHPVFEQLCSVALNIARNGNEAVT